MRYNFCTLFDRNYLYRGLALHNSLTKHCPDFWLWILCMDDICYEVLQKLNLSKVELVSLQEFEDQELLKIKNNRNPIEYYWTCTSSLLLFLLKKYPRLKMLAYLDADLFFFANPEPIYDELREASIMIIPHRYSRDRKFLEKELGIYNVSMLNFRNDPTALKCLEWWKKKCIEWCFSRAEGGKFGDQNYLNDWPKRFPGTHVLKHKGANLAPWNIGNYKIRLIDDQIFVDEDLLIFYHFHYLKIYPSFNFQLFDSDFNIKRHIIDLIYKPYLAELTQALKKIKRIIPDFNYGFSPEPILRQRLIRQIKKILKPIPFLYPAWHWFRQTFLNKKL